MLIEQDKYIATTEKRILCAGGWKLKSNLNDCQVKLFPTPSHVKQFLEDRQAKHKFKVEKVKVRIEVLTDESWCMGRNK